MKRWLIVEGMLMAWTLCLGMGQSAAQEDASKVRLWDTGKVYTEKGPMADAWGDKGNWTPVSYGATDYEPLGDLMIEGETFYLFLFTNKDDSVDLMAKIGDRSYKPNEIYKVHDTGLRNFGHGTMAVKILKNTAEEIVVEHAGEGRQYGTPQPIVTT